MAFKTDNQTLNDIGIFTARADDSIYALYNHCRTQGGEAILDQMFRNPLSDAKRISERVSTINFFEHNKFPFPFNTENFAPVETYINNTDTRTQLSIEDNTLRRKMSKVIGGDTEFNLIHGGIVSMLAIINQTQDFIDKISSLPNSELITKIFNKLPENIIETAIQFKNVKKLNYENCVHIDDLLRFKSNLVLSSLLRSIYYIDVYYSISEVVEKRNFVFAEVVEGRDNYLNMKGVYHPKLKNGIGNDITIDEDHNIVFLTGANMAGKSTIMKSISIALYVAHVGFPVAAEKMEFTIQGGMYTTINLADNINVGYSHFYSEVMRLKRVSQEVSQTANLFIIFDELFRGTNVKDAYDATIAVVEAFSTIRECTFIVSTHIIEAGEVLKEKCPNMQFLYMPTVMENGVPRYLYKAKEGITEDRHGMVIINNEKIIDILEQSYKE